jgi:hypothetical protein
LSNKGLQISWRLQSDLKPTRTDAKTTENDLKPTWGVGFALTAIPAKGAKDVWAEWSPVIPA